MTGQGPSRPARAERAGLAPAKRGRAGAAARQRLFVALALPGDVSEALAGWAASALGRDDGLRLVERDALHVTLAFLGWREPGDSERTAATVADAVAGLTAPRLEPTALVALPRGRPRVLVIGLADEDERAAAAHDAGGAALAAAGLHEPERRRFRPHVTVARVRRGSVPGGRVAVPLPERAFSTPRVVLYRSHLRHDGAHYEELATAVLAAPGA